MSSRASRVFRRLRGSVLACSVSVYGKESKGQLTTIPESSTKPAPPSPNKEFPHGGDQPQLPPFLLRDVIGAEINRPGRRAVMGQPGGEDRKMGQEGGGQKWRRSGQRDDDQKRRVH